MSFFFFFFLFFSFQLVRSLRVSDFGIRDIQDRVAQPENVTFPFSSLRRIEENFPLSPSFVYIYDFFNFQSFVLVNFYRLFETIHFPHFRRHTKTRNANKHANKRNFKQFRNPSSTSSFSREKKKKGTFLLRIKRRFVRRSNYRQTQNRCKPFRSERFEGDEFGFHRLLVTGHRNQMTQSNSDCISRHYLALINTYVLPLPLSSPPR